MPVPIHPELSRIDPIFLPQWAEKNVQVSVLRLDLVHPVISGNKWFKLRYYLDDAIHQGFSRIITFGGAWSNHILATAAACKLAGLHATGIIRGEEPPSWSATLLMARDLGMDLRFVGRQDYREKKLPRDLGEGKTYLVPEGGQGPKGVKGAATICELFERDAYSHICCATGTGTMMAGLVSAAGDSLVTGINVLKNPGVEETIRELLEGNNSEFVVCNDYHFGGYARYNEELINFMNGFFQQAGIPSDFVYTGKLFWGVNDLIQQGFFPAGSKILVIHSGGLQGNSSLENGTLIW
jgi:1-aminocyclopropane-1-carboxylate deaminase